MFPDTYLAGAYTASFRSLYACCDDENYCNKRLCGIQSKESQTDAFLTAVAYQMDSMFSAEANPIDSMTIPGGFYIICRTIPDGFYINFKTIPASMNQSQCYVCDSAHSHHGLCTTVGTCDFNQTKTQDVTDMRSSLWQCALRVLKLSNVNCHDSTIKNTPKNVIISDVGELFFCDSSGPHVLHTRHHFQLPPNHPDNSNIATPTVDCPVADRNSILMPFAFPVTQAQTPKERNVLRSASTSASGPLGIGHLLLTMTEGNGEDEVVISGISCRLPGCDNILEFKEKLFAGVDLVTTENQRFDTEFYGIPRFGQLNDVSRFDASFFNIRPAQADKMDPALRMLLEVTYEAVVDSGCSMESLKGSRTGVFVGSCPSAAHTAWTKQADEISGFEMTGCHSSMLSNEVSHTFGLQEPSITLSTACSSSLVAIDSAVRSIRSNQCDSAIVAAAKIILNPLESLQYLKLGMLSPNGRCLSFDEKADGYCRSEGVVAILLQRKGYAQRNYATVLGSKVMNNGQPDKAILSPSKERLVHLIRDVYKEVNINVSEIAYVEAHGTGTQAGDKAEIDAICDVLCEGRSGQLVVGSVKSNIGHTEEVSGLVGVLKVVLAMEGNVLPGNIHFTNLNKKIEGLVNGKIQVVKDNTPWKGGLVGINSFGFGGTNAHVILHKDRRVSQNMTGVSPNMLHNKRLLITNGRTENGVRESLTLLNNYNYEQFCSATLFGRKSNYRAMAIGPNLDSIEVKPVKSRKNDVWLIFTGMGCQWNGMGKQLVSIDMVFESLKTSDEILKKEGFSLIETLTDENTAIDTPTKSFVCILAIQIALYSLIRDLGIEVSGYIGHSVGLSVEETLSICPDGVTVACHNASDSVTVSGKKSTVQEFVGDMKSKNIFAKEVDCSGIAFHSTLISGVKHAFMEMLIKIIPEPKRVSGKWITTSVPCNERPEILSCSPTFLVDNLLNPVLFYEAVATIPDDALVVEVAPHALLQSLLKRSLKNKNYVFGFMKKDCLKNEENILRTIGSLWINGVDFKTNTHVANSHQKYPQNVFLAPLVKWDHRECYQVPTGKEFFGGSAANVFEHNLDFSIHGDYAILKDHVINGHCIFPAAGVIYLAWKAYASFVGRSIWDTAVVLKNVSFERTVFLSDDHSVERISTTLMTGQNKFEMNNDGGLIAFGEIHLADKPTSVWNSEQKTEFVLRKEDIYQEMKLMGYDYGPDFRGIVKSDINVQQVMLEWKGNWISFLDLLLQMMIFQENSRALKIPRMLSFLEISPQDTRLKSKQSDIVSAQVDVAAKTIQSRGVVLGNTQFATINRRKEVQTPTLMSYSFRPYIDAERETDNLKDVLNDMLSIVCENTPIKLRVLTHCANKASEYLRDGMIYQLRHSASFEQEMPNRGSFVNTSGKESTFERVQTQTDLYDLIVKETTEETLFSNIDDLLSNLNTNGFLLFLLTPSISTTDNQSVADILNSKCDVSGSAQGKIVALRKCPEYSFVFLLRKSCLKINAEEKIIEIPAKGFEWVYQLQNVLKTREERDEETIWLYSEDVSSGIVGLVNSLRQEPSGERIRCVFLALKTESPSAERFIKDRKDLDLVFNIYNDGKWGTFSGLLLEGLSKIEAIPKHLEINDIGDLTSFSWKQHCSSTGNGTQLAETAFVALNFRDVMLATGKLPVDAIPKSAQTRNNLLGMEFSGIDCNGQKIMGMTGKQGIATRVETSEHWWWGVPDQWSLEEAATVPVAYATAYYAFVLRGNMKHGEHVLIHSGSGALGQAAIAVALSYDCSIYTTVGGEEKAGFLLEKFQSLKRRNIFSSRNKDFEQKIMAATDGHGQSVFLKNASFLGIHLDFLHEKGGVVCEQLHKLVQTGIEQGVVRPLDRHVFPATQAEEAFRLMTSGKHRGKILLKMKDDIGILDKIPFQARVNFDPMKSYIVTGGLGGMGLELADWLSIRGARHLVLTSRSGVRTGYQKRKLQQMEVRGTKVVIAANDVSKLAEAEHLIAKLTVPLGGVFHLALVLKDGSFLDQTPEFFKQVCDPKVEGAKNLDIVTRRSSSGVNHFVVFSTLMSKIGYEGLSNYSFANSAMERIIEYRRRDNLSGLAIQYGLVGDVGVSHQRLKGQTKEIAGTTSQTIASCLEVLDHLLLQQEPVVSSFVLAEKADAGTYPTNIFSKRIFDILGMQKDQLTSTQTLENLGLDSFSALEVKQLIERKRRKISTQHVRDLTVADILAMDE
ncbi:FAS-like protein [Mya arenaria]|uniref:Fatty acid synthase n=2 Tax=Mya arenaria TaxID=6604 RepID=A0ABY7GJG2_MYAAR|nr:FAS-like protein [Mya arenaria]